MCLVIGPHGLLITVVLSLFYTIVIINYDFLLLYFPRLFYLSFAIDLTDYLPRLS